jgi:hypothetical protein
MWVSAHPSLQKRSIMLGVGETTTVSGRELLQHSSDLLQRGQVINLDSLDNMREENRLFL